MHVAFRRLGLGLVRTVGAVGLVGQVGAAAGQESAGGKPAPAQVSPAATTPAAALVDAELPALLDIYRGLHRHPELSHHEVRTAAFIAGELRKLGFSVTERVGRYADGTQAYGVVAVLANGPGPTVLVRTELDALPVTEATGLPDASVDRSRNQAGDEVGVMHACGHDIHMTSVLGTARAMVELKSRWHGRLMVVAQPAEEVINGARAMLADHLYERFGRPDYAIALHDTPLLPAGTVAVTGGPVLANASTVDVTLRGVGGHGASPRERMEESRRTGVPLPSLHSSRFAPLPEPTLRTGVLTETNALLELFGAATATD